MTKNTSLYNSPGKKTKATMQAKDQKQLYFWGVFFCHFA